MDKYTKSIITIAVILLIGLISLPFLWQIHMKKELHFLKSKTQETKSALASKNIKTDLNSFVRTPLVNLPDSENGQFYYTKAINQADPIWKLKEYPLVNYNNYVYYYRNKYPIQLITRKNLDISSYLSSFENIFRLIKKGNTKKHFAGSKRRNMVLYNPAKLSLIHQAYFIKTITLINEKKYKEAEGVLTDFTTFVINTSRDENLNNNQIALPYVVEQYAGFTIAYLANLLKTIGYTPHSPAFIKNLQTLIEQSGYNYFKNMLAMDTAHMIAMLNANLKTQNPPVNDYLIIEYEPSQTKQPASNIHSEIYQVALELSLLELNKEIIDKNAKGLCFEESETESIKQPQPTVLDYISSTGKASRETATIYAPNLKKINNIAVRNNKNLKQLLKKIKK